MNDLIRTDKVLDLLAGVVAEIIKMPPEEPEKYVLEKPARDLIDKRTIDLILGRTETHENETKTHACDNERTETHGDLISRKAAIERIKLQMGKPDSFGLWKEHDEIAEACYNVAIEALKRLPSAEPSFPQTHENDRKHGKWEFIGDQLFLCSECKRIFSQKFLNDWRESLNDPLFPPHCPNCGSYNGGESE